MVCSSDFKDRYGRLLIVLNTDVKDGVLNTLVQFYDSTYKCFTFPDYQLAPTLEEYSYYIGLHVSGQIPFSGLEEILKSHVIGKVVHLRKWEIDSNRVTKGGILGLPTKFLKEKADMKTAFEAQIRKLKRKLQHGGGSSLVMVPLDPRLQFLSFVQDFFEIMY